MTARLSQVRLTGRGKVDAKISFAPGANVVSGDSDTGKSYILKLIDYALGADELTKVIDEAAGYELVWVQFQNAAGAHLTLKRHLTGGDVEAFATDIDNATSATQPTEQEILAARRRGKSTSPDITSRLFPFLGLGSDVRLRANAEGRTQRLTVRTLLPLFIVDEEGIITESSPIAPPAYGSTPSRRAFSYLLTGVDDSEIVAQEVNELARARVEAKVALIDEMLAEIEQRINGRAAKDDFEATERLDATIGGLSTLLSDTAAEREQLRERRDQRSRDAQKAASQIIAIDELLNRYSLLAERYVSDLERLDFLAEGAHYYSALQDSRCPTCGKLLSDSHQEHATDEVQEDAILLAARGEASKIRGLQADLQHAILDLHGVRNRRSQEQLEAADELASIEHRLDLVLAPARQQARTNLQALMDRRLELQDVESDREELSTLRQRKERLLTSLANRGGSRGKWSGLDSAAVSGFCATVETILVDWSWRQDVRVEFDETVYDIKVDGKPRRSHGKGYRAVLNAAMMIGLAKYCFENGRPHPGFVVLDSPLTTVKQRTTAGAEVDDDEAVRKIEPSFWMSIAQMPSDVQIIILDNKEPPKDLHEQLNLQVFAGMDARGDERAGFIPT